MPGFGVGAEEKVREDPKRLFTCSRLSSCKSGQGRIFSGCFDQDDISQLTKGRRRDDVQLPLRSLMLGRFAETCIHATLLTEFFFFFENIVLGGKNVIYVSM